METVIMILLFVIIVSIIGLAVCVYYLIRNDTVYIFRCFLCDLLFDNFPDIAIAELDRMPTYEDMLYRRFGKLCIEKFFSEELCAKLRETETYRRYYKIK